MVKNENKIIKKPNYFRYYGLLALKHRRKIFLLGSFFAILIGSISYIQTFQSSTFFRFQISETRNSNMSDQVNLETILGKTEIVRDKSMIYAQSIPFYFELSRRFAQNEEGRKIIPIIFKSKKNILLKLKTIFFETFSYNVSSDTNLQIAQAFQKIISFNKDSDNTLIMFVKAGSPNLAIRIGAILGPIVREILIENEFHDLAIFDKHLTSQLEQSNQRLKKVEEELLTGKQFKIETNRDIPSQDLEKELRMAKIDLQRHQLLINKLESEIKEKSIYKSETGAYRYIDQVSIERLNELKQNKDLASAKVASLEKSLETLKTEQLDLPQEEHAFNNLKARYEVEYTLNKDLILKARDFEGLKKLTDSSIRIIGSTSLVPIKFKVSRPLKIILGFLFGIITALLALYYYFDYFPVITDLGTLSERFSKQIITVLPEIKSFGAKSDVWKTLPTNHMAVEAIRPLIDEVEGSRIVSILGNQPGDGKSFIISNLAFNLARFGKKVLIIDTNWTSPKFDNDLSTNIKVISSETFQHDKGSIIDRELLINTIKAHSRNYDYVLIDTCASAHNNDYLVVASVADLNLVIGSFLETFEHKLASLVMKLENSQIHNYAFILNKVDLDHELLAVKVQNHILNQPVNIRVGLKKVV
jgi:Mrp family chromosome partitioning ATPase